jgi:hypothetical protein
MASLSYQKQKHQEKNNIEQVNPSNSIKPNLKRYLKNLDIRGKGKGKGKGKAFPLEAWTGPWVSWRLRLQNF